MSYWMGCVCGQGWVELSLMLMSLYLLPPGALCTWEPNAHGSRKSRIGDWKSKGWFGLHNSSCSFFFSFHKIYSRCQVIFTR